VPRIVKGFVLKKFRKAPVKKKHPVEKPYIIPVSHFPVHFLSISRYA
jgi:hypothetical protein